MNFLQTDTESDLNFIRANEKDIDALFEWINDADVRAQSLTTHRISYDEHTKWFFEKMANKNCYLYIAYKNNQPIGMIRFDIREDECNISYLVDAKQRGKGNGPLIVNDGIKKFKEDSGFKGFMTATVKRSNLPSIKIFERLKFDKVNKDDQIVAFKKILG